MFAYRTTWLVKRRQMHRALELLKAEAKRCAVGRPAVRIYTPSISPEALVFEMDCETAEAHDAFWAAYNQDKGAAPFQKAWDEVVERSLGTERWEVTEV